MFEPSEQSKLKQAAVIKELSVSYAITKGNIERLNKTCDLFNVAPPLIRQRPIRIDVLRYTVAMLNKIHFHFLPLKMQTLEIERRLLLQN